MRLFATHPLPDGTQYSTRFFFFSIQKGMFKFQWKNATLSGFEIRDIRLHRLSFSERPNILLPPGQQIITPYWKIGNWIFKKIKAL